MNEMVQISRTEYDFLRAAAEELRDLQAFDRARAAVASGEDELIAGEYADRLLAGESPLRVFRAMRGLSQVKLSETARVHRVQIADIEAGRKVGSVATVRRLADALGVTIDDLTA